MRDKSSMKILQISAKDIGGGAEKVAFNLHKSYQDLGHRSWLVVGRKKGTDPQVVEIPDTYSHPLPVLINFRDWLRVQNQSIPGLWRLSDLVDWIARPGKGWDNYWGVEDFHYPGTRQLLTLTDDHPDIVHAHNLHGWYFDLRYLPKLSKKVPLVITLHDEWMLTGHCAYTIGCERWEYGCGMCPDLTIYPAIKRDGTAHNWKRKSKIYQRSNLYIASPSQWLMDRVQRSTIRPSASRVIPNGVDLNVYCPGQRLRARQELGLPKNAKIILAVANWNRFKDFSTIEKSIARIGTNIESDKSLPVLFIALGGRENETKWIGKMLVQKVAFISEPGRVAKYFMAADIFLHAAHVDNFPNTILEAMACGTPIIATSVGGIHEQVIEGQTGFLVRTGNSDAMAERVSQLLSDSHLLSYMGHQAAEIARKNFSLERQANTYLNWYQEILEKHALPYPG